jgi:hypothetical protein
MKRAASSSVTNSTPGPLFGSITRMSLRGFHSGNYRIDLIFDLIMRIV